MSETRGIVTARDGDYAIVRTEDSGCGRCHESGGCGGVRVSQALCTSPREWRVLNPRGAAVGEEVRIAVSDGAIGASALLIYVQPLGALLGGAILGSLLAGEAGAIGGGAVGLLLSWRWVAWRQKRRHCDPRFHPHIV
ncbi:SoxR reducing system RseC family protein [Azospira restricta]|uniref:SoxR reducing system RseC family protein n=1 Tax=Azospira restricta TaxID=404405 RepID=A0A974PWR4_9RHOO|nr:SoxR reducing system RseC family protein [Azospira restricta]QRJ62805.1 SoxR reducing system RseC family protein [Azospira restricta]